MPKGAFMLDLEIALVFCHACPLHIWIWRQFFPGKRGKNCCVVCVLWLWDVHCDTNGCSTQILNSPSS